MGAGFYGIALDVCAAVMLECITAFLQEETSLEEIIICVIDYRDYQAFEPKLSEI